MDTEQFLYKEKHILKLPRTPIVHLQCKPTWEITVIGTEFNVNTSKDSTQMDIVRRKSSHTYQGHIHTCFPGNIIIHGNGIKTFQGEFGYLGHGEMEFEI